MKEYVMHSEELERYCMMTKEQRKYQDHLHRLYSFALTVGTREFLKQRVGCDLIETLHVFRKIFHQHTPAITKQLLDAYGYE